MLRKRQDVLQRAALCCRRHSNAKASTSPDTEKKSCKTTSPKRLMMCRYWDMLCCPPHEPKKCTKQSSTKSCSQTLWCPAPRTMVAKVKNWSRLKAGRSEALLDAWSVGRTVGQYVGDAGRCRTFGTDAPAMVPELSPVGEGGGGQSRQAGRRAAGRTLESPAQPHSLIYRIPRVAGAPTSVMRSPAPLCGRSHTATGDANDCSEWPGPPREPCLTHL